MKKSKFIVLAVILCGLLHVSCGYRSGAGTAPVNSAKPFPDIQLPSVISDPAQRSEYIALHYWDDLQALPMGGSEAEQALASFLGLLQNGVTMECGKVAMSRLFSQIEKEESRDTSRHVFTLMTQLVSRYLYDPNSPLRNEDLYLPFVSALASSPFTSDDMRTAYRYEAESCSLNQYMSVAPDFAVRTITGDTFTLHSVRAQYIMLFFSNPGCTACKEIIDQVMSFPPAVKGLSDGRLAVVNVYIDEDLKAWREYEHNYPTIWKTGYDLRHVIRGERLYDVRAIPSLYLLDGEKHVLMKDAPVERVLSVISTLE